MKAITKPYIPSVANNNDREPGTCKRYPVLSRPQIRISIKLAVRVADTTTLIYCYNMQKQGTLIRGVSQIKPQTLFAFDRTKEIIVTSFSLPWNPSIVLMLPEQYQVQTWIHKSTDIEKQSKRVTFGQATRSLLGASHLGDLRSIHTHDTNIFQFDRTTHHEVVQETIDNFDFALIRVGIIDSLLPTWDMNKNHSLSCPCERVRALMIT